MAFASIVISWERAMPAMNDSNSENQTQRREDAEAAKKIIKNLCVLGAFAPLR